MTGAGGGGFLVLITKEPDMADKIRAVIEEKEVLAPECHIPPTQAKKKKKQKGKLLTSNSSVFLLLTTFSANHSLNKNKSVVKVSPEKYNLGDDRVKFYNLRRCEKTTTKATRLDFAGVVGD